MKKRFFFLLFIVLFLFYPVKTIYAQSAPVLYFCERYDETDGEIGISDRFTLGFLTVVIKSDYELGLRDVTVQFDKYDHNTRRFKFYKNFNFVIEPEMKYVYFSKNENSDMSFEEPGFYRVFLLNKGGETITSSLVQIVE